MLCRFLKLEFQNKQKRLILYKDNNLQLEFLFYVLLFKKYDEFKKNNGFIFLFTSGDL